MRIDGENAKKWFKGDYLAMARAHEACWDTTPRNRPVIRLRANCPYCEGTGTVRGDEATECGFCD